MRYIIAYKTSAVSHGFQVETHRCVGDLICLNEKEVMNSVCMSGDLEERAGKLNGVVCDQYDALAYMNKEKTI